MATAGDTRPAETLNCLLCLRQFLIPRILPCLHTICEQCLDIHIRQHEQGRCGCPVCNTQIFSSDTKVTRDNLASTFPLNDLINSLIESQNKSDNDDNYCQPCQGKNKISAEVWCVNCQERLCNPCNQYHKRQKQSKHHRTVPMSEMDRNIQSIITLDHNCTQHPGHKLETFCVNHRALCCGVCFATNHRDCVDIRDIKSAAEDQAKCCNYGDIMKQICKIKTEMDKILADKINNRSQIKIEKEQIINTMDVRIDQIIGNLNTLRVSFKNEAEKLYEETNNFIINIEKQIKCFQTNITNTQQILETLQKKTSSHEKFMAFEILRSQVASHYEQLKLTTQDDVEIHLSLNVNDTLRDIEEGLSSLGVILTSSKQSESFKNRLENVDDVMKKLFSMSKLSTALSTAQTAKRDPMTSPVTFVKVVTARTYGSDTCFTGGTVLPDGRLLMTDCNNRRLVQLGEEYNIVNEYKIDGKPKVVAAAPTNNEIYITVYGGYIYKCILDTALTVVSRIKAPSRTWSIAVGGDNIIVCTDDAVVILNQDGTTVKSIPKTGDSYVAVSQIQRTMYHIDNNDVVCRTLEGREQFRYRHQQLKRPTGICTDTHGCTYICGHDYNNVHQMSPDGKTSRILELHAISRPLGCVFLPQQNELLVTSYNKDTVLEVHKLK